MAWRDIPLNRWTALFHKQPVADADRTATTSWVPKEDRVRLEAYKSLQWYLNNAARTLLPADLTDEERAEHREYGDAALLVARVVAGVLGDDMQIVVDGADVDLPDGPQLDDPPEDPGPDAPAWERQAFAARLRVYEADQTARIEEWEATATALPGLRARQEWLRQWADRELFDQRVWEAETDAVGLGDTLYVLGWSQRAQRVQVRVFDPGFYFPVLDDEALRRGYPTRVHVAWEEDRTADDARRTTYRVVRRMTWELVPVAELDEPVRPFPWAPGVAPTEVCCWSDGEWRLDAVGDKQVADLSEAAATWRTNEDGVEIRRLPLAIDFLPVVHVPNTPSGKDHFGESILARVLQLLDDLAAADTDTQKAAALAGSPMVAMSGDRSPTSEMAVKPGVVFGVGPNGRMDVIDLSKSVEVLIALTEALLDRLAVNVQVPGEVVGRVDDTGPESGFARLLKRDPYKALIGVLRLVRVQKMRLFFSFQQKLSMAGGALEPGEVMPAGLRFGSFLPADQQSMVELVVKLVEAKIISRSLALTWLVSVGLEVGDAAEVLAQVQAEDFEGAGQLADATEDAGYARDYLGLAEREDAPAEAPPAIVLPGGDE